MAINKIPGNKRVNGTFAEIYVDGELIAEAESFSFSLKMEREDILQASELGVDSKLIGMAGEGNMKLKKVYSRFGKKVLEYAKEGKDFRPSAIGTLADPDAYGHERVSFDEIWFNDLDIIGGERKKVIEEDINFGYNPSTAEWLDEIAVQ